MVFKTTIHLIIKINLEILLKMKLQEIQNLEIILIIMVFNVIYFHPNFFLNKKIKEIKNLYFEIDELKKIGCKYLLSTKPIKNVYSLELNFTKFKNKNKDAFIKNIYVYKI